MFIILCATTINLKKLNLTQAPLRSCLRERGSSTLDCMPYTIKKYNLYLY